MSNDTGTVVHNTDASRFELTLEGHTAVLDYRLAGQTITFTHTGVPTQLEGRGIGSQLAKAGLAHARENGLKVKALCWFVNGYIERHPEYQDLI